MTFERQMDMILYGLNVEQNDVINQREKWQNKNEKFENFILDVISNGYWQTTIGISRSESILSLSDQKSAVESVESLLKPRIHAFLKEPVRIYQDKKRLKIVKINSLFFILCLINSSLIF